MQTFFIFLNLAAESRIFSMNLFWLYIILNVTSYSIKTES